MTDVSFTRASGLLCSKPFHIVISSDLIPCFLYSTCLFEYLSKHANQITSSLVETETFDATVIDDHPHCTWTENRKFY